MSMGIYLTSDRVFLRDFVPTDEQFIRELDSDPAVMRYISGGEPSSASEIKRAMGVFLDWQKKHNANYGYWVAEDKLSKEFIGWFHLRPLKSDSENLKELELGYRLKQKFWGKGIATEVSKLLVKKAFREFEVNNVWATTMRDNLASKNVMLKCGMKFIKEGTMEELHGPDKTVHWFKVSRQDANY